MCIRDSLYISRTGTGRVFKFGVQIDRQAYKPKNAKVGQKGSGLRHVTYFYISGMGKDTDLKFSVRIELNTRKPWNAKIGQ